MKLVSILLALEHLPCSRKTFWGQVHNGVLTCSVLSVLLPDLALAQRYSDSENTLDECPSGANLAPEVQVPGSYTQSCMYLPSRSISLQSIRNTSDSTSVMNISQGMRGPSDSVTGRTGVVVWNSALLLTRLLDAINEVDSSFIKDRVVLELGMGTGLSSIASAKLGAAKVYGTDGNIEVVELATANVKKNNCSDRVSAHEMKWGLIDAADFYDVADLVIGSDLTYNSGSWKLLAETVSVILKPGGLFLYLSLGHSGFNVSGEMAGFVSVAESEGLRLLNQSDTQKWPIKNAKKLGELVDKQLTNTEKDILKLTGGVSIVLMERK